MEGASGEPDQRVAPLRPRPGGGAVGVDRLEDIDADASERQPHHVGRRRAAAVARPEDRGGPPRVDADVVAERRRDARIHLGGGEGEREVGGTVAGLSQIPQGAALDDREAAPALEAGPLCPPDRLHEGGRREGAGAEQGVGEDVELALGELPLRLEESGRGGELADRERRQRLRLVRGAERQVALPALEGVTLVVADDERAGHRADGDRRDSRQSQPEAKAHSLLFWAKSARAATPGAFASDSQR